MARIGILGGTFDPPHNGHIAIARAALDELNLLKVIFIPANMQPHKNNIEITPAIERIAMLRLAIAGNDKFEISDIELHRDGPSYTVDTLIKLRELYPPDELMLLIGADNVQEMESWFKADEIAELCTIAAVNRPGFTPAGRFIQKMVFFHMSPVDISSTEIRRRLKARHPITGMIPKLVEDYILNHRLYIANE